MRSDLVQIKATIPRDLKRRAFAELAGQEIKFKRWLENQLQDWLERTAANKRVANEHTQRN